MMMVVYVDLFFRFEPDIGFNVFGLGFVSYRARILSSTLTLIIFFAKQACSSIINHKTAAVVLIRPNIVWLWL